MPHEKACWVEEFRRLQGELPAHLRAIITIACFTGMPIGDLKNLQWSAVNLLERTLTLHSDATKSGEARIMSLNYESRQLLILTP